MADKEHEFKLSIPYNPERGCPSGYHKRSEYKTETGKVVPARCVKATTVYKNTSKEFKAKEKARMTRRIRLHIPSIRTLSKKDCPPGYIPRKAYVRRYSTAVRAKGFTVKRSSGKVYRVYPKTKNALVESRCVKDLGLPGKGPRSGKGIAPLRKGELAKYGYSFRKAEAVRHAALRKAASEFGALGVYRKLDAVAKLSMRVAPAAARVFVEDKNWVKRELGPLKAF